MNVKIIVDSTADMTQDVAAQLTTVPLSVHFGSEEYLDGITLSRRKFYEKLIESDVMPTTSQATPHAFHEAYTEAVAAGFEVVVITISSALSGTYQSAVIAAQDFPGKVYVVDSHTVTVGAGILAEYALQLVHQGLDAAAIAQVLEKRRDDVRVIALLDTLEYLKRGGRISKTAAFAGGLLSIKPVLELRDGEIHVLGKARGSKQGNNLLVTEIEKAGGVNFSMPVLLGYTGLNDCLLQKYVADSSSLWEGYVTQLRSTLVGSVVGTHVGPGAIAVAFFHN